MITWLKKKIRNYILGSNDFSNLVFELLEKHKKERLERLKKQLQKAGENISIESPYIITGLSNISIGNNFSSLANLRIDAISAFNDKKYMPAISIGKNVTIQSNCHIGAIDKVVIEDDVLIAGNVYISDHLHGNISEEELHIPPINRDLSSKGPVIIHKNVWIGDSVCILPGVTIGENAIIGANSVVTKSVPANAVVAGVPAVVIKQF